ncbi:hypothetical protein Hthe01_19000 [Hydrogenophilus thermoluteolus]|uniref:S26 family signal peptidase n=1 Tax=Hydrogenophilus thermoluteolus TaxID=297 RepID=UPI0024A30C04|nr:S26 family signal peptidase [Hydrogenophilus thermoluteolus]GLW61551.1 hypothetical protein Hthe01_19000 [Hydrogenophilus thermoluteolus]
MLERLYRHFCRRAPVYLWVLVCLVALSRYYMVSINVSDSLPGVIYLIEKGTLPEKGELVAFRYAGGGPYERGSLFLKRVVGVNGSVVSAVEQDEGFKDYYVDGQFVGRAKPYSKVGLPLPPGPVGVIPKGRYYVAAPNPDSLDSRYAWVGWVTDEQIVGRAIRIF